MKQRSESARKFLSAVYQMARLAWQAQKVIFVGLLLLQVVQGFMPLASAWITKAIFDALATILRGDSTGNFAHYLLPWLALLCIQGVVVLRLHSAKKLS